MQMSDNRSMAKRAGLKDTRISVRLSGTLRQHLEAEAQAEGRSLGNLVARVLQLHVDAAKAKKGKAHG